MNAPAVIKVEGLKFKLLREVAVTPVVKRHIIKGIFARGETSAWVGPPGSLKSALMASAAVAIPFGSDWFGRRNKERCGVVYFALERNDLVERRLRASAAERDLPIAIVSDVIDIFTGKDVGRVIATLREAQGAFGCPTGMAIFDTFAKLLAAGGGDEDKARDQGRLFANIQRIKNATDCRVALVGHTGKDESRGSRGSNAIKGDVDVEVMISGDAIKTATVIKANDIPEGPLFSFKSETHDFGIDEDGDPVTVNIVSADACIAIPEPHPKAAKLPANQRTLFAILEDAGAAGLLTEEWNAKARDAGIGERRRADLTEARLGLKKKGLVREYADRWHVNVRS